MPDNSNPASPAPQSPYGFFNPDAGWNTAKDIGGFFFGNGDHPGIFGTGQYAVDPNAGQIPGFDTMQQGFAQGAQAAGMRGAPIFNGGQQAAARMQQGDLVSQLIAQGNGQGPSLAQGMLQQGTDRNLKQALAFAQSTPMNGSALRNISQQRAAIAQQGAQDSAQLRLQEQLQARNQLGQVLSGMRGQDIGVAQTQQQAQLQQESLNDQMVRFYQASGMSLAEAQQQAAIELQKLKMGAYAGSAASNSAFTGQVLGAAGSAMGFGATGAPGMGRGGSPGVNYVGNGIPGVPDTTYVGP